MCASWNVKSASADHEESPQTLTAYGRWHQLSTAVALHIRQSLDLARLLQTTVDGVQQILGCDRVLLYQVDSEESGKVTVEAVSDPQWSLQGWEIGDIHLAQPGGAPCQESDSVAVNDIATANLPQLHADGLTSVQVKAYLAIPVLNGATFWGWLIAHSCNTPRCWSSEDIDGLQQIAVQVGLAIRQVALMEQLQAAEAALEAKNQSPDAEPLPQIQDCALCDSQQWFQVFMAHAPLLAWIVNTEGIIDYANPAWVDFFGHSEQSGLGRSIEELFPADLAQVYRQSNQQVMTTGKGLEIIEQGVTVEGETHYFLVRKFPIFQGQQIMAVGGIAIDITERQRIETARRESEARWQFALEGSGYGVWDWNAETNDVFYSPQWKAMLDYSVDEIGHSLDEWDSRVHPDDKAQCYADLEKHFKGETPIFQNEHRIRCKDGSYRWILDRGKVIEWMADGRPKRVIGTHTDISDRKRIEDQLRQSEATNRAILIAVPDLLLRVRRDGVCDTFLPPSDGPTNTFLPIQQHLSEVLPPDLLNHELQRIEQALATGELQIWEQQILKQGVVCDEEVRVVPCGEDNCLVIVRDITDRKQAEAQLRNISDRLTLAVKSARIGIWSWEIPEDRLIWDDRMYELYGVDPANFAGAYQAWESGLHPEDQVTGHAAIQQALEDKQDFNTEFRVVWPDGTIRHIKAHGLVQRDPQGNPLRMIGVNFDITDRRQAELDLKAAKDQLELYIHATSEGFWDWNMVTNQIYFSPRWKEILGYADHELDNTLAMWESVMFAEDYIVAQNLIEDYNSGRVDSFATSQRFHHKNGSTVYVLNRAIHLKDDQGQVIRMVGSHLDITENKRQELALQDSEARYRHLIETTLEGVWMLDSEGKTTFVNQRMAEMLGYDASDMQGKSLLDFMRPEAQVVAQDLITRHQQGIGEQHSFKFRRQDGTELWAIVSATPIMDEQGNYQALIGLLTDVTEFIEVQQALKISELQLSGILNSSLDGIMAFQSIRDERGTIIDFEWLLSNPTACTIVDQPVESLIGRRMLQVLPGNREEGLFDLYVRVVETGEPARREFYYNHDDIDCWFENISVKLGDGFAVTFRDITEIKRSEQALQLVNQQLEDRVGALKQRNQEMLLLSETSDFLQACRTIEEACAVISTLVRPLFPDCSGGFFIASTSSNRVELVAFWGEQLQTQTDFHSHDCWALRRGRLHQVGEDRLELCCNHVLNPKKLSATLCIPMIAQSETLGLFYLNAETPEALTESKLQLARTVAEQVGLAIANLHLRETLQIQSIRDALTGLFNRRYLEEALQQEIGRAQRNHYSIGVVMIDVDHFKQFNDTYGHEVGDYVLQTVGKLLKDSVRSSDIACRYGGEEMTLVLPETSLEEAQTRAEAIRDAISRLKIHHNGNELEHLTVSLGVACFPQHGGTGAALVQAADASLYRAKAAGRNQVMVAP